jgi:hypothetical protein
MHDSQPPPSVLFWRAALGFTLLAAGALLLLLSLPSIEIGRFAGSLKWRLAGLGGLLILAVLLAAFTLSWTPAWERVVRRAAPLQNFLRRLGLLNLLPILAAAAVMILLVFVPIPGLLEDKSLFTGQWVRMALIGLLGALISPFLKALRPALQPAEALLAGVLALAVVYRITVFVPEVDSLPFSLGWSEGSRFYYASLFFSPSLYGERLAWPFLHPSRYLMQSIPYIIPDLPLLAHRLWQVLLWLGMSGLTSGLLARRLAFKRPEPAWIFAAWSFLFLFQGPVYYHLLVPVCIVLAWFNPRRFWRSLAVVILASAWAGISRINWYPVPALLAISLYLLETRFDGSGGFWRYLRAPVVWGVAGGLAALASQAAYVVISRQPSLASFGSSFTSDLLWYRLLPSVTYPNGILPMSLEVSAPLILLMLLNSRRERLNPLRALGLWGTLLLIFAAGLVVSAKIGGGSNLHNMDSYLVILLLWGGALWGQRMVTEIPGTRLVTPWLLVALAALMPIFPLVLSGNPLPVRDHSQAQYELSELRNDVVPAAQSGPVLFIWQRHMLTMGLIDGVALEPDYETVELMEMAMSNNRAYLEKFYTDLREHRFTMIVAMKQNPFTQEADRPFAEENNIWVERVAQPVLMYYQPVRLLDESLVEILVPRED